VLTHTLIPPHGPASLLEIEPAGELTGRILQAISAVYLIVTASSAPDLNELVRAVDRIDAWLVELRDEISSIERADAADAASYGSSCSALTAASRGVRDLLLSSAKVQRDRADATAGRAIALAAARLSATRVGKAVRQDFLISSCAADLHRIAESRIA